MEQTPDPDRAALDAKLDAVLAKLDDLEAAIVLGMPCPVPSLPDMPAVSAAVSVPADCGPITLPAGETTALPDGATIKLTLCHEVKGAAHE